MISGRALDEPLPSLKIQLSDIHASILEDGRHAFTATLQKNEVYADLAGCYATTTTPADVIGYSAFDVAPVPVCEMCSTTFSRVEMPPSDATAVRFVLWARKASSTPRSDYAAIVSDIVPLVHVLS